MPKIPSPAAFASRPPRPLTARPAMRTAGAPPAAPVRWTPLPDTAPFRMRYEQAIRHSELPKNARLLALTIATWGDWRTGVIPADRYPGVPLMGRATAMVEGAVRQALEALLSGGWLRRLSSPAGGHAPSQIILTIPPDLAP